MPVMLDGTPSPGTANQAPQDSQTAFDEPAALAVTREFDDFDTFAHALRSADAEIIPMSTGRYASRLSLLQLGGLEVMGATVPSQINHGIGAADRALLLMPLGEQVDITFNGHPAATDNFALLSECSPIDSRLHMPSQWVGLTVPTELMDALLPERGIPALRSASHHLLQSGPGRVNEVASRLLHTVELLARRPDRLRAGTCAAALREALHAAASHVLDGAVPLITPRSAPRHQRIARAAADFMEANLSRPIYTEELCAAIGVSARGLQQAFATIYGCSPHAYLKRRRLMLAHRALMTGGDSVLVKTVALDHGFWHLGNFARDYRLVFGAFPSEQRGGGGE